MGVLMERPCGSRSCDEVTCCYLRGLCAARFCCLKLISRATVPLSSEGRLSVGGYTTWPVTHPRHPGGVDNGCLCWLRSEKSNRSSSGVECRLTSAKGGGRGEGLVVCQLEPCAPPEDKHPCRHPEGPKEDTKLTQNYSRTNKTKLSVDVEVNKQI
ncbi:hypothetical protein EYF80_018307 [Liparis tanakae]|uniref:Uncharacterized protein n=1 Tax=Liparis tanakae TaxID=230148 RepID=A0A4Z2I2K4_9TELE|nr:hypothetical protein EYF80_018307 [Liparis tanakae]